MCAPSLRASRTPLLLLGVLFLWIAPPIARSLEPRPELLAPVVGQRTSTLVSEGETLLDIAFSFGLGFEQVVRMNPEVDVWIPNAGERVELPTQVVLPATRTRGLVLNIPEMRLFDFRKDGDPTIYAVAVGDPDDPTPIGEYKIGRKRVDPQWNVPQSIREERPELPAVVPPGADNPLGDRWMTLGTSSYGIHGTNNRWSIGHESTHGCVRLYNRHMHALFEKTPSGTPVTIVYETVKLGRHGRDLYLEVHPDLYAKAPVTEESTLVRLLVLGLDPYVDRELVLKTLREARGAPVVIGRLPESTFVPTS